MPHEPSGSVPCARLAQTPGVPPLQNWQPPVHADSQHTPSVQNPLAHWLAPMHIWPFDRLGVQAPALQKCVPMHWLSIVHDVKHAAPLHAYPLHDVAVGVVQVGVGEQVAAAVNMPAVQLAVPQVKPSVW